MNAIISFFSNNYYLLFIIYILGFLLLVYFVFKLRNHFVGNFHEANVIRKLKKIYHKYNYPYIKEIILPINQESYAYYDAIVFGDKFIYLLEIKNHAGTILIDPLDDWIFIDSKKKKFVFMNPFYELELKKHILNRFLEINKTRIIEIVVYNNATKLEGSKGKNHLISFNKLSSIIRYYEEKENVSKIPPNVIEKKGNYILEINVKKRKIRKEVINGLKDQRMKR